MATTNAGQEMKTINIRGKQYVQVKDRVLYANENGGYKMLEETVFDIGNRAFLRVKIEYDGNTYYGTSEIKLDNAERGSADEKSPMECAETSAVGRAFAFAGIGVMDSIASADEMARAGVTNNYAPRQDTAVRGNSDGEGRPTEKQVAALKRNNIPDEILANLTFEGAKQLMDAASKNNWKYPWQEGKPAAKAATQAKATAAATPRAEYIPDDDIPF